MTHDDPFETALPADTSESLLYYENQALGTKLGITLISVMST